MRTFVSISLCLLVLVFLGRIQEIFLFLVPLQLGKVGVFLGLVVVLVAAPQNLLAFIRDTPFGRCMLLILVLAILGLPFSVWPGGTLKSCISLGRQLLMISIIVGLALRVGAQTLRFSCMLAVGIIVLQIVLEKSTGRVSVGARYDPNDIALLLTVFLPIVVAEALHGGRLWRPFARGMAAMAVMGIVLTGSRGGILALAVVGFHVLLTVKTRRWMLVPLLAIGVGLALVTADDTLWERFGALRDDSDYNLDDKSGRLSIWEQGIGFIIRNPILGVGLGQFSTAGFMHGLGMWLTAHNSFIQIGAELGLPGLVAFVAILGNLYRLSKKGVEAVFLTKADRLRFLVLRFSLTGYCVGGFFISQAYGSILYTLLALSAVMLLQFREAGQRVLAVQPEGVSEEEVFSSSPDALKTPSSVGVLTREQRETLLSQGDTHALQRKGQRLQGGEEAGPL